MNGTIKYVPTSFAEPLASALAEPPVAINVYDKDARRRFGRAVRTLTANSTANDIVGMMLIPKGARVLASRLLLASVGTAADIEIGVAGADGSGYLNAANTTADDPDFFLASAEIQAAATQDFGRLGDKNGNYLFDKDVILTIKLLTGAVPSGAVFTMDVQYVVD
jgi:hypothetical protein